MKAVTQRENILLVVLLCGTGFLLFIPHLFNAYPIHVDEWHHITEALLLREGAYTLGSSGLELGFHVFLAILSFFSDLVILYRFLPALYGILTALIVYVVVRHTTQKEPDSVLITLLTILFFVSIKSNVHTLGTWFFVPLTFCIPLIFLYLFCFTQGVLERSRSLLITSLILMLIVLVTHPLSLLAFIPLLLIYSIRHRRALREAWRTVLLFAAVPFVGLVFYLLMMRIHIADLWSTLSSHLIFYPDWGVFSYIITPTDLYSPIGYACAAIGLYAILSQSKSRAHYEPQLLWVVTLFLFILFYALFRVLVFVPYERAVYSFVLGLPFMSAYGVVHIMRLLRLRKRGMSIMLTIVILLMFMNYFTITDSIKLYEPITEDEYVVLKYLATIKPDVVMAPLGMSMALYPVSGHTPVATSYFYGNRTQVEAFYSSTTCLEYEARLPLRVSYVVSPEPITCGWVQVHEHRGIYVYAVPST